MGHGAHRGDLAEIAFGFHVSQFIDAGLALHDGKFDVAAQYGLALFIQALLNGSAEGANHGDGGHAEREAAQENPKAFQARTEIACRVFNPEVKSHFPLPLRGLPALTVTLRG